MDISIERLCIENGLKMTGPRRVIARVLSEATDHPDVDELHRRANRIDPRISLATVYRTVRLLEAKGMLARRDLGSRRARYEPSGERNHFHLVDQETGSVLEFAAPQAEAASLKCADAGFATWKPALRSPTAEFEVEAGFDGVKRRFLGDRYRHAVFHPA